MLLHDLVLASAETRPSNPALIKGDNVLYYEELGSELANTGEGLACIGVLPGDRVAVYLNKRVEAVLAYFGVSYAGAIFVPINPILKPAQVRHILIDCDVKVLVTTAALAASLRDVLCDCDRLDNLVIVDNQAVDSATPKRLESISWAELINIQSVTPRPARRIDTDVAAILYTSGSTGKPKGVVLSHRNMVAGALSVASYIENEPNDVILAVLPFSFDAGFSQMTTAFSSGASVVLIDYLFPTDIPKMAAKYAATGLTGVPPLWNQLSRLEWPKEAMESLRYIANTGGAMPTATLTSLRKRLPRTKVFLMYGLTESFRSTYLPPEEIDNRPTSIGKVIPNAEVLVVNDDGNICGPGEPGELVHRGALVSLGYWNDKEKTAERFRPAPCQADGLPLREIAVWSGDTVVTDEEGFLFFVGRKDDMIKSSGYRISPTEVEEVIYATRLVNECAAIGLPHRDLGQAVVIVCQTDNPNDAIQDALINACKENLPNYMVPADVLMIDALPRNPNGKIDRKALSAEYAQLFSDPD
ncbi:MAG: acyl-CoA ligase (AMP-forming), exosortase A system-associated [Proteobacteria bacterium]|nr:acyl-CoA ligase (AMP-forming), exosortase A system-associated [Pseudomonadota bacterium]